MLVGLGIHNDRGKKRKHEVRLPGGLVFTKNCSHRTASYGERILLNLSYLNETILCDN